MLTQSTFTSPCCLPISPVDSAPPHHTSSYTRPGNVVFFASALDSFPVVLCFPRETADRIHPERKNRKIRARWPSRRPLFPCAQ